MDIDTNGSPEETSTAVSIFGQGQGANDFPVLKAFQEYIDAEQAKARKRMLGLSIFFIVLLVIVVVTFTLIVVGVINRNQSLSDRLLEAALRQQQPIVQPPQPQPVVNVQPPAPQPAQPDLTPVLDKIEKLATAIANKPQPQPIIQPAVQPIYQQPLVQPTIAAVPNAAAEAEVQKLRDLFQKEKEKLAAERKKLKEEQHQVEVERQRRRLYPAYYAQKDAEEAAAKKGVHLPASTTVEHEPEQLMPPSQPKPRLPKLPKPPPPANLDQVKPISYFDKKADEDDIRLQQIAAEAAKRKAAAEAAKRKAAAEAAEAAKRKATAEAAKQKAAAEAAEAARRKAAAEAAQKKSAAEAAEAARRKTDAENAKKQAEAKTAEAAKEAAEAQQRKAEEDRKRAEAAVRPQPKTEIINVSTKDSSGIPWIIQRLSE